MVNEKKKLLLKLSYHLTSDDIELIKYHYDKKVGRGLLEKCKDSLELLKLLNEKGYLESKDDYQFLLHAIGRPTLLKGIIIIYNVFQARITLTSKRLRLWLKTKNLVTSVYNLKGNSEEIPFISVAHFLLRKITLYTPKI